MAQSKYTYSYGILSQGAQYIDAKLFIGTGHAYETIAELLASTNSLVPGALFYNLDERRHYQIRSTTLSGGSPFTAEIIPAVNFPVDSVATGNVNLTSPTAESLNISALENRQHFILAGQTLPENNGVYRYDAYAATKLIRAQGFSSVSTSGSSGASNGYRKFVGCSFVVNNPNSSYNGTRWHFVDYYENTNGTGTLGDDFIHFAREIHYDSSTLSAIQLVTQNKLVVGEQAKSSTTITYKELEAGATTIKNGDLKVQDGSSVDKFTVDSDTGNVTSGSITASSDIGTSGKITSTLEAKFGSDNVILGNGIDKIESDTSLDFTSPIISIEGETHITGALTLDDDGSGGHSITGDVLIGDSLQVDGGLTVASNATIGASATSVAIGGASCVTSFTGKTYTAPISNTASTNALSINFAAGNFQIITLDYGGGYTTLTPTASSFTPGQTFVLVIKANDATNTFQLSSEFLNLSATTFTVELNKPVLLTGVVVATSGSNSIYATLSIAGKTTL